MVTTTVIDVLTCAADKAAPGAVVGTSHLLLALREVPGIASEALAALGVRPDALASACAVARSEPTDSTDPAQQLSEPAQLLLMRALEESTLAWADCVDTGHVLLAVTGDTACDAMRALAALGIAPGAVRERVRLSERTEREAEGSRTGPVGFDRFTDGAKHVMGEARAEAQRLEHDTLSTGHVLLGLLHPRSGSSATILASALVRADDVRVALGKMTREAGTERPTSSLPFSAKAKTLLENALIQAQALGASEFGSEHLLIGLLEDENNDACRALTGIGVDPDAVRDAALRQVTIRRFGR